LPYFVIWKNTVDVSDGYVCGLEPSTNFPNPRTFEETKGRVYSWMQKLQSNSGFALDFTVHAKRLVRWLMPSEGFQKGSRWRLHRRLVGNGVFKETAMPRLNSAI
ncbi:MAG: hypothetical protein CGW95_14090, partial [Phenylobacterium zucineum]